ncbi:hypothetical protein F5878DRAFT_665381 [Lentinula raphanica]|uniref:Uncharacterized protein n=1 Tax=Lentinula raphanica TaxID=153919 RepID=A0AA38NZY2_9AGAR|nr:hypothetical protein F5880DRAFT_1617948 [Lentinula raphanica]KAJ3833753.1 hypothetical protein F5878DRAFT_665381 [Lentinula raphanica]
MNLPPKGRLKFDVSLTKLIQPGADFTSYRPATLGRQSHQEPQEEVSLTPQQQARRLYEERNRDQRREKAREHVDKNQPQNKEKSKKGMKRHIANVIERSVDSKRIDDDASATSTSIVQNLSISIGSDEMDTYNAPRTIEIVASSLEHSV